MLTHKVEDPVGSLKPNLRVSNEIVAQKVLQYTNGSDGYSFSTCLERVLHKNFFSSAENEAVRFQRDKSMKLGP